MAAAGVAVVVVVVLLPNRDMDTASSPKSRVKMGARHSNSSSQVPCSHKRPASNTKTQSTKGT